MEINKDFREFIELLNEHKVEYLVIGGYAINLSGYPRDLADAEQLERIKKRQEEE